MILSLRMILVVDFRSYYSRLLLHVFEWVNLAQTDF